MLYLVIIFLICLIAIVILVFFLRKKVKPLILLPIILYLFVSSAIFSLTVCTALAGYNLAQAERYYNNGEYEKQLEAAKNALKYAIIYNQKKEAYHWQNVATFKLNPTSSTKASNSRFLEKISQARNFYSNDNDEKLLEAAKSALKYAIKDNEKAEVYYWMGVGYFNLGNTSMARESAETSLKLIPNRKGPYLTLSFVEGKNGNHQKSLEYAQKCSEIDPKYSWCYNNIGIALVYLGKKEEGIKNIEKAISLDSKISDFQKNLEWAKSF